MKSIVAASGRLSFFLLVFAMLAVTAHGQRPGGTVMFRLEESSGSQEFGPREVTFELYKVGDCCVECKPKPCWKCCPLASTRTLTVGDEGKFTDLPPGEYIMINKVAGAFAGYEQRIAVREKKETRLGTLAVDYGVPMSTNEIHRMRPVP